MAVCTRDRPQLAERTLRALLDQDHDGFPVLVVDQSAKGGRGVAGIAEAGGRVTVVRDRGRGLSRARNVAWRRLDADWIVFVDDDCIVEPGWAAALHEELAAHPDADFVSGHVGAGGAPGGDYRPVTTYPVDRPRRRAGAWTRPYLIGFGVCMAVRRSAIERLGGWDERLGAGVPDFPASEDMDFNYRLLRAGGVAYSTPRVRSSHHQWRRKDELPPLWRGYMAAWAAFSVKHLRTGDVAGGLWLWTVGLVDTARVFVGAFRRRSRLSWHIAVARLCGYLAGTRKALARRW